MLPVISGDGRHVAFQSDAFTLVANDVNGTTDVFVTADHGFSTIAKAHEGWSDELLVQIDAVEAESLIEQLESYIAR